MKAQITCNGCGFTGDPQFFEADVACTECGACDVEWGYAPPPDD